MSKPKLYFFEGEMLSAYKIALIVGRPIPVVRYRLEHGIDPRSKPYACTIGRTRKPVAPFHRRILEDGRIAIDRKRWETDQAKLEANQ